MTNSKKYIKLLLSLMILSLISCNEDSFTKIVDVDIEEEEQKLAIIAEFNSQSELNKLLVSETIGVLDTSDFKSLSDAEVTLNGPDGSSTVLQFDEGYNLHVLPEYDFVEGAEYSLIVDHPLYQKATSVIKVPTGPEIISMDVGDEMIVDEEYGNFVTRVITVRFKDPIDESNFYSFSGKLTFEDQFTGSTYYSSLYFDLSNNFLEFGEDLLSDITFDGEEYELILVAEYFDNGDEYESIELEFTSFSEEKILYERSLDIAYESLDNPFIEPSTIYTNFDNSFGIFVIDVSRTMIHTF